MLMSVILMSNILITVKCALFNVLDSILIKAGIDLH